MIVYCTPKAPGYQRVEHWVKESPDSQPSKSGESVSEQIGQKHLGLWELWVFYAGEKDEGKRMAVADVAPIEIGKHVFWRLDPTGPCLAFSTDGLGGTNGANGSTNVG